MRSLIVALCVALLPSVAAGQASPEASYQDGLPSTERIWFGTGLGPASGGMGYAGHRTFMTGRHAFTLRSAGSLDPFGEVFSALSGSDASSSAYDFGVLYSRPLVDTPRGFVSVGAGIGGAQRMREDAPVVLGLPLEVQATVRLSSWFGLGLYGFGDLNREQSFGGFTLGFQAGKLW